MEFRTLADASTFKSFEACARSRPSAPALTTKSSTKAKAWTAPGFAHSATGVSRWRMSHSNTDPRWSADAMSGAVADAATAYAELPRRAWRSTESTLSSVRASLRRTVPSDTAATNTSPLRAIEKMYDFWSGFRWPPKTIPLGLLTHVSRFRHVSFATSHNCSVSPAPTAKFDVNDSRP